MSCVHVYTGNGKGKTTASLGISLRAVCAGKKVFFLQFVKGMKYSELKAQELLPNFEMKRYGRNAFIRKNPKQEDIDLAKKALNHAKEILNADYDLVVLDEINIALFYNLLTVNEVIEVIKNRTEKTEVVMTGRYAKDEIIEFADLVTEMKEIKHYYKQGIHARVGIEK